MRKSRVLGSMWIVMAMAIQFGAQAQPNASTTMTRDELRACMGQEAYLRGKAENQQQEAARSNEEAASIAAESASLIRASVNGFKDKAARDAHVTRSNLLDKRVNQFNAKTKQIRLALADIQADQAEYLRKCGGKNFYVEDKNAILAERETSKSETKPSERAASATQPN